MITLPVTSSPRIDWSLHLQCTCTLLVTLAAAYVSYQHGREFALRFGADEATAVFWPLVVGRPGGHGHDRTVRGHRAAGRWTAWLSFIVGIGLSLCANIASAPELNAPAIAVAACPPPALLLSVDLLTHALQRHRDDATAEADESAPVPTSSTPWDEIDPPAEPINTVDGPASRTAMNKTPDHGGESSDSSLDEQYGISDPCARKQPR
ncbi:Protein of unknown function [Haloechinothrix alba]|uniref:DUF2637 domain-containing protein n=1 Tax=Haloechinothrix alba TaxID=664784 RepID=A0A238Y6Q6_9PSEU|nr:DUF2637 domain-containing protein [Haloechinothrix alba]SNR66333.1 Protein of unknown function [Haloechinothrix alba]